MVLIVHRYLVREIGVTTVAVVVVLLLVLLSATLVRVLTGTAEGEYPANLLLTLLGLKLIGPLTVVIPLAFFIALLLALGRLTADYELYALFACGMGYRVLVQAVATVALGVSLLVWGIDLGLAPWADEQRAQILDAAKAKQTVAGVVAGRFQPLGRGRTLYVTEDDPNEERIALGQITLFSRHQEGQLEILTAERVEQSLTLQPFDQLRFQQGYRYQSGATAQEWQQVHFAEYRLQLPPRTITPSSRRDNAVPTATLWQKGGRAEWLEIGWRLFGGTMVWVLALLALSLSRSEPRQGRYGRLALGVVIYLLYYNGAVVWRSLIEQMLLAPLWFGAIHLLLGLWGVIGLLRLQQVGR